MFLWWVWFRSVWCKSGFRYPSQLFEAGIGAALWSASRVVGLLSLSVFLWWVWFKTVWCKIGKMIEPILATYLAPA
jgi:hypothetical protein